MEPPRQTLPDLVRRFCPLCRGAECANCHGGYIYTSPYAPESAVGGDDPQDTEVYRLRRALRDCLNELEGYADKSFNVRECIRVNSEVLDG